MISIANFLIFLAKKIWKKRKKYQAGKREKKSISLLIKELKSFEDQDLVVMVTDDEGKTFKTVKLVSKGFEGGKVYCALHI